MFKFVDWQIFLNVQNLLGNYDLGTVKFNSNQLVIRHCPILLKIALGNIFNLLVPPSQLIHKW